MGKLRDAAEADDVDEANYITADVPDMPQRQQQQQEGQQQQQQRQQQQLRLNKEEAWFCLPKFQTGRYSTRTLVKFGRSVKHAADNKNTR